MTHRGTPGKAPLLAGDQLVTCQTPSIQRSLRLHADRRRHYNPPRCSMVHTHQPLTRQQPHGSSSAPLSSQIASTDVLPPSHLLGSSSSHTSGSSPFFSHFGNLTILVVNWFLCCFLEREKDEKEARVSTDSHEIPVFKSFLSLTDSDVIG